MSKSKDPAVKPVLDDDILGMIGASQRTAGSEEFSPQQQENLQARIMARIDAESIAEQSGWVTVRTYDGAWERIAPKIEKKLLQVDEANGTESYLLRVEPGAEAPPHRHETDEICIMLDGEVRYGDFFLRAGDYHFAPKGSIHGEAHSEKGALLFIHAGINSQSPV